MTNARDYATCFAAERMRADAQLTGRLGRTGNLVRGADVLPARRAFGLRVKRVRLPLNGAEVAV